jgi:Arc/MetJ-type ribon-helix-helix transcriptional regulator
MSKLTIRVPKRLDDRVEAAVEVGDYNDTTELVREALRDKTNGVLE